MQASHRAHRACTRQVPPRMPAPLDSFASSYNASVYPQTRLGPACVLSRTALSLGTRGPRARRLLTLHRERHFATAGR
eukprot:scaffold600_cov385-Prasinococcus_capsulatus_cf.AAC.23